MTNYFRLDNTKISQRNRCKAEQAQMSKSPRIWMPKIAVWRKILENSKQQNISNITDTPLFGGVSMPKQPCTSNNCYNTYIVKTNELVTWIGKSDTDKMQRSGHITDR